MREWSGAYDYDPRDATTLAMLAMLASLSLVWPLFVSLAAADAGASQFFDVDIGTCSEHHLEALYHETLSLTQSCEADLAMLLHPNGIDLEDEQTIKFNKAWNTRHAFGVRDLEKEWKKDFENANTGPRPPKRMKKMYSYSDGDANKLTSAQQVLEHVRLRLEGETGQEKLDVICDENTLTTVDTVAYLADGTSPMVLTVLGACQYCSFCTTSPLLTMRPHRRSSKVVLQRFR